MKREIKFRAWLTDLNKMETGLFGLRSDGKASFNSECVLMQLTGLKDKNGVDIYESDIVEVDIEKPRAINYLGNNNEYCTFKVLVEWDCGFCYRNLSKGKSWKAWHIKRAYTLDVSNIKIIGNIYENPELCQ